MYILCKFLDLILFIVFSLFYFVESKVLNPTEEVFSIRLLLQFSSRVNCETGILSERWFVQHAYARKESLYRRGGSKKTKKNTSYWSDMCTTSFWTFCMALCERRSCCNVVVWTAWLVHFPHQRTHLNPSSAQLPTRLWMPSLLLCSVSPNW